jgi:hypothetical protein
MRRLAGLGMLALVLLPANGASAAATRRRHLSASLHYQRRPGASGCPSEAELRKEVKAILGYSPFVKNAGTSLSCVLWTDAKAQHARIQLRDLRTRKLVGQRDLSASGPGCEQLGSAVALAIALAVDPLAKPPARPEVAAAAPVVGSPPTPPPPSVPVTPPPTRPTRAAPTTAASRTGASRAAGGKGTAGPGATATVGTATSTVASVGGGQARPLPDAGFTGAAELLPALADAGILTLVQDAGPAQSGEFTDAGTALALAPLLLAAAPDAGGTQTQTAAPDAGAALALAPLALLRSADAGPVSSTASASTADAGVPAPTALVAATPDAGLSEPGPGPAEQEPVATDTASAPGRPWHVFAGAEGDLTVGLVPSTAFGASLFVGVAWPFASAELEARWIPSTSIAFQGGTISSTLFSVGASGCALFGPWGACGVVEAGPFSSTGSGYAQSIEASTWVVSLGARAQWTWVFANPVGLRLHVDGLASLIRPRLLVNASQAWEAPPVSLVVGAGLYARF